MFLALTLRIWLSKEVTLKYIPCSKYIFSLLVFSMFLALIPRCRFFKLVTLNYIPCSKCVFSLLIFSYCIAVNINSENLVLGQDNNSG